MALGRPRTGPLALAWIVALAAPSTSSGDLAEIQARGSLRVLASADEDPAWFAAEEGPRPGFEREVLEGFARLHKLRFERVPVVRWEDAIPMLLHGQGDVLGGISATDDRRLRVDFSVELLPARSVVVTRRPHPSVRTLAELRSSRLVIVADTTWAEAVEQALGPAAKHTRVPDLASAIAAVRAGRADATVIGVVDFFLQRRKLQDLEAGRLLGEPLSSAWAVRKSCPELRQALDAYLAEFRRGPNWSRLLVKYFGADAPAILGREPVK